jgi:hypothetical protein
MAISARPVLMSAAASPPSSFALPPAFTCSQTHRLHNAVGVALVPSTRDEQSTRGKHHAFLLHCGRGRNWWVHGWNIFFIWIIHETHLLILHRPVWRLALLIEIAVP